ncbi:NPC1-like intracellular cholesterol transporter 1 [Sceloporus undulatus]|uniref:NPC1-like intracellular cholesterol transporter 1 n=1 Tax=Sceloporus undulatus TaxID=8520 RepID=UPI001C4AE052|nr:NPC1-like intracellular cholesterol transporter 1 [Sceloporus undulatus]
MRTGTLARPVLAHPVASAGAPDCGRCRWHIKAARMPSVAALLALVLVRAQLGLVSGGRERKQPHRLGGVLGCQEEEKGTARPLPRKVFAGGTHILLRPMALGGLEDWLFPVGPRVNAGIHLGLAPLPLTDHPSVLPSLGWGTVSCGGRQAAAPTEIHREGYCAFYGDCGKNPEISGSLLPGNTVPCLSNTPARRVSGLHLQRLRSICPALFTGTENTLACCSEGQLEAIERSLRVSQVVLSRCPACAENFANLYCQNICSPNQSVFTNVTRTFSLTTNNGSLAVGILEYQCYYNQAFADASYDSCKGVQIPATGGYAIGAMCGKYGAALCNTQRWLDYQGDPSNGLAPLAISYHLIPEGSPVIGGGIVPFSGVAWQCNKPVGNGTGEKCSCQDCAQSCPAITAPSPPVPPFQVRGLNGALFVCIILFCVLMVAFAAALLWRSCSSSPAEKPKESRVRMPCSEKLSQATDKFMAQAFSRWGTLVASYPRTVILISVVVVVVLSNGLVWIQLTTNPVELWSSPESQARQEKAFYEENFGPFFRTNQAILTVKNQSGYTYDSLVMGRTNFSSVLSMEVLLDLLELQRRVQSITVWSAAHSQNVSLQDVCYAPLNPQNASLTDCALNSLLQYFQNNQTRLKMTASQTLKGETGTVDWRDHFLYCINSPLSFKDITALELSCMADYGAPVFPFLAVGGYSGVAYSEAQALILTVSLNNFPSGDPRFDFVMLWEKQFLKILEEFQQEYADRYTVAYMAERSLEDEISRSTWEDLPVFALSYLLIFAYIALALGQYSSCKRIPVDSKVTLGLGGILVVLGAVLSSLGFYSYMGVPSSLIILEVVPFLVLALGADNIFIFVLEFQRSEAQPGETPEERIGRVLGDVAPSMLLCSLSEVICFFLGGLTPMPAVKTFALYAAMAVFFDFLLQMSAFVALLSLDARRQEASRLDLCCCIRLEGDNDGAPEKQHEGLLCAFMRRFYAPFLLNGFVRFLVVLLFSFMFCAGIFLMLNVQVGLEQELSVPTDSYMLQYFQYLNQYLMVGAPTYFVTSGGYNFSTVPGMNGVCSSSGCDENSMLQKIQYATRFPEQSFLAIPATSWVDDFIDWLNPFSSCCRIHSFGSQKGEFCPSTDPSLSCIFQKCMAIPTGTLRPSVEEFDRFLPWFLHDKPNLSCSKGGLGAYDTSVKLGPEGQVLASRFMAYHTPLKNSQEYTAALKVARELAANITASMREVPGTDPDFQVFPYTITYVFYEQYLAIAMTGFINVIVCLVPTFLVCYILLGMDLRSAAVNLVTIVMIVVDTVGAMTLWGVSFNAISLINLVAAVGISVEFVSHITRSFAISTLPTKVERAKEATVNMGSAVFAGVAMTNLPGVVVLAFAKAQLVQLFFFRLNLLITLLGMLHGLVFLPVILSYFGKAFCPPAQLAFAPDLGSSWGIL